MLATGAGDQHIRVACRDELVDISLSSSLDGSSATATSGIGDSLGHFRAGSRPSLYYEDDCGDISKSEGISEGERNESKCKSAESIGICAADHHATSARVNGRDAAETNTGAYDLALEAEGQPKPSAESSSSPSTGPPASAAVPKATATDWENDEYYRAATGSSNQFNTCHQHSCLRHTAGTNTKDSTDDSHCSTALANSDSNSSSSYDSNSSSKNNFDEHLLLAACSLVQPQPQPQPRRPKQRTQRRRREIIAPTTTNRINNTAQSVSFNELNARQSERQQQTSNRCNNHNTNNIIAANNNDTTINYARQIGILDRQQQALHCLGGSQGDEGAIRDTDSDCSDYGAGDDEAGNDCCRLRLAAASDHHRHHHHNYDTKTLFSRRRKDAPAHQVEQQQRKRNHIVANQTYQIDDHQHHDSNNNSIQTESKQESCNGREDSAALQDRHYQQQTTTTTDDESSRDSSRQCADGLSERLNNNTSLQAARARPDWPQISGDTYVATVATADPNQVQASKWQPVVPAPISQSTDTKPRQVPEEARHEEKLTEVASSESGTAAAAAPSAKDEQEDSGAMEILQRASPLEDRLAASAKSLPNNTLIVDLNECHPNITNLWPNTTHATKTTLNGITSCWPQLRRRKSTQRAEKIAKRTRLRFLTPKPLLRMNINLRPADYDSALSMLTGDVRYQLHLFLYGRVQFLWLLVSTLLCILIPLTVFTTLEFLVMASTFGSLWLGLQLNEMLEKSVAQVNGFFMDHNLMLGVINAGGLLSKSRLMVPMLYFDTSQCREQIESIIRIDSRKDVDANSDKLILDYSKIGLPLTRPDVTAFAQSLAKKIVLRFSQRWISHFDKRKLMFTDDYIIPRHLSTGKCFCQFIEEHFRNNNTTCDLEKPKKRPLSKEKPEQLAVFNPQEETIVTSRSDAVHSAPATNGRRRQRENGFLDKTRIEVPTLSVLVSAEERNGTNDINNITKKVSRKPNCFANDMDPTQQQTFLKELRLPQQQQSTETNRDRRLHGCESRGEEGDKLTIISQQDDYGCHLQATERKQRISHKRSQEQSPSHILNMELDGEASMGQDSDYLVRKLRLLLELRRNELKNNDGSLLSGVLYQVPQQQQRHHVDANLNHTNHNASGRDTILKIPEPRSKKQTMNHNCISNKVNSGRKFLSQSEGLFFLGANGSKKQSQQQQQPKTNPNHIIEIC